MKRHTCIVCGRKRNEIHMKNVFLKSWACSDTKYVTHAYCYEHSDVKIAERVLEDISNIKNSTIRNLLK